MKLNDRCEIRDSGIHGKGVFAICSIAKGTDIIQLTGEKIGNLEGDRRSEIQKREGKIYLFMLEDSGYLDCSVGGSGGEFINHSCEPNCESEVTPGGQVWVRSIKDISVGEELFFDYFIEDKDLTCLCKSPRCRGYI